MKHGQSNHFVMPILLLSHPLTQESAIWREEGGPVSVGGRGEVIVGGIWYERPRCSASGCYVKCGGGWVKVEEREGGEGCEREKG